MAKLVSVDYLVVHCSGTPPELDTVDAMYLDRVHRGFGWRKIGFHLVIKRDGTVQRGRVETEAGQHLRGFDDRSLAVCLVGGLHASESYVRRGRTLRKPWPDYTDAQMSSLRSVLDGWTVRHPSARVMGHSDAKRGRCCPCFDVGRWYHGGELVPEQSAPMAGGYVPGEPL